MELVYNEKRDLNEPLQDLNTQQNKVETPDSQSNTSYELCDHQCSYVSAKTSYQNSRSEANILN